MLHVNKINLKAQFTSASKHFSYVQTSNTSTATVRSVANWCLQTVYKELWYCNAHDAGLRTNELLSLSWPVTIPGL